MRRYLTDLTVLLSLIFLTIPAASQGSNDPFVGTFSGSGLQLTLTGQNGHYSGSVLFEGQVLPVSAEKNGTGLISGSYVLQGESLPFQGRLQGNTLTLASGGEVSVLTRQAGESSQLCTKNGTSNKIENDEWGLLCTIPAGWSSQLAESGNVFGSNTLKGIMLLLPNEATSLEEMRTAAREGIKEAGGTHLRLTGKIKPFTKNSLATYYTGTLRGGKAKA